MKSIHFQSNYLSQSASFLRDVAHKTQSCCAKISQVAQLVFTSLIFKGCCSLTGLIILDDVLDHLPRPYAATASFALGMLIGKTGFYLNRYDFWKINTMDEKIFCLIKRILTSPLFSQCVFVLSVTAVTHLCIPDSSSIIIGLFAFSMKILLSYFRVNYSRNTLIKTISAFRKEIVNIHSSGELYAGCAERQQYQIFDAMFYSQKTSSMITFYDYQANFYIREMNQISDFYRDFTTLLKDAKVLHTTYYSKLHFNELLNNGFEFLLLLKLCLENHLGKPEKLINSDVYTLKMLCDTHKIEWRSLFIFAGI